MNLYSRGIYYWCEIMNQWLLTKKNKSDYQYIDFLYGDLREIQNKSLKSLFKKINLKESKLTSMYHKKILNNNIDKPINVDDLPDFLDKRYNLITNKYLKNFI